MIHSKSLNVGSVDYVGMVQYLRHFFGNEHSCLFMWEPGKWHGSWSRVIKRPIVVLGKRWQFHFGMFDFPGKSMVAPWSIHTHPAALEAPTGGAPELEPSGQSWWPTWYGNNMKQPWWLGDPWWLKKPHVFWESKAFLRKVKQQDKTTRHKNRGIHAAISPGLSAGTSN